MPTQVSQEQFEEALLELGHDPNDYRGKKLSLVGMCSLYGIPEETLVEAIRLKRLKAHYDFGLDQIWIDALEAAHFYFSIRNESHLYAA